MTHLRDLLLSDLGNLLRSSTFGMVDGSRRTISLIHGDTSVGCRVSGLGKFEPSFSNS